MNHDPKPSDLLPGFQGDDDEDGSPVHAAHTAAVAHEVVQDGGELGAHLRQENVLATSSSSPEWASKRSFSRTVTVTHRQGAACELPWASFRTMR